MQNTDIHDLNEALKILNSKDGEGFANQFEISVGEALTKLRGESNARIISAAALLEDEKKKLQSILSQLVNRKLTCHYEIDPNVLGGFKAIIGDWKIDFTLSAQLKVMKKLIGGHENG